MRENLSWSFQMLWFSILSGKFINRSTPTTSKLFFCSITIPVCIILIWTRTDGIVPCTCVPLVHRLPCQYQYIKRNVGQTFPVFMIPIGSTSPEWLNVLSFISFQATTQSQYSREFLPVHFSHTVASLKNSGMFEHRLQLGKSLVQFISLFLSFLCFLTSDFFNTQPYRGE